MKQIPLVIIAGWSGSGKTTLVEKLIPELKSKGLVTGTIKHHHSNLEFDKPGKDSWRHRKAGAVKTIVSSPGSVGMVVDVDHDPDIDELLPSMTGVDFIIVEGYKDENKPKIEIFRSSIHKKPRFLDDPNLIALASDVEMEANVPVFSLDDAGKLAGFIVEYFNLKIQDSPC